MDLFMIGLFASLAVFGGLFVVGLMWLGRRLRAKKEAELRSSLHRLPGVSADAGLSGTGTLDGRPYRYELAEAVNQNTGYDEKPRTLTFRIDSSPGASFTIRSATGFDLAAKSIGLVRERQTGDPEFDAQFYVETESTEEEVPFRLTAADREAI